MQNFRFIVSTILFFLVFGTVQAGWLVRIKDPRTHQLMLDSGCKLVHRYKNFPLALYERDSSVSTQTLRKKLNQFNVEAGQTVPVRLARTPNDPRYTDQQTFHPLMPEANLFLPKAWEMRTDASNVVVAILDGGFDTNHPDLQNNLWTNTAEAQGGIGVDDDGNSYVDDLHGWNAVNDTGVINDASNVHGTEVCGILGAEGDNGIGIAGICWKARMMLVQVFGASNITDSGVILKGLDYAMSFPEVRIINASWGTDIDEPLWRTAFEAVAQKGILVVAAAGNDSVSLDDVPFYPASYPFDNIVSVAAINMAGQLASFSGYGSQVTVAAPGISILTTLPNADYGNANQGTSFATPIVSGAAALLLASEPALTASEVRQRIVDTSRHTSTLEGVPLLGGLLNVQALLRGSVNSARSWFLYAP